VFALTFGSTISNGRGAGLSARIKEIQEYNAATTEKGSFTAFSAESGLGTATLEVVRSCNSRRLPYQGFEYMSKSSQKSKSKEKHHGHHWLKGAKEAMHLNKQKSKGKGGSKSSGTSHYE